MDELKQKALDLLTAVQEAFVPTIKQALDLTLRTIHVIAEIDAIRAALVTGIILFSWFCVVKKVPLIWAKYEDEYENEGVRALIGVTTGVFFVVTMIILLIQLATLFDTGTWLGIFYPDLALTHQIMEKFMKPK